MSEKEKISFSTKLCYYLLLGSCKAIGLLPYFVLYYMLAPFIYLVIYRLMRYRVKVVRTNLQNSFPERSVKELRSIERKFYHHLSELFIDTIDMSSMSKKQLLKRMKLIGEEAFDKEVEGKSWILTCSHYGSWEYFSFYCIRHPNIHVLGAYQPLHSKVFEMFYSYVRNRFGLEPTPMKSLYRKMIKLRKEGELMVPALIADQSPAVTMNQEYYTFLNQPTYFVNGLQHLATGFSMPVYFFHITKLKPSFYEGRPICIYDGVEEVSNNEITRRYISILEKMIVERPELWLWSHRRWKRKPPQEIVKEESNEN